jgi:hypothetical protein
VEDVLHLSPPEPVDGHIRFRIRWGGLDRHIFISDHLLAHEVGRELTRQEAAAYVSASLPRFTAIAMKVAKERPMGMNVIVTIAEIGDLALS